MRIQKQAQEQYKLQRIKEKELNELLKVVNIY